MHNKLVEILEELNIPIGFQKFEGEAEEYIIFNIYDDEDSNFFDNENLSETYYICINIIMITFAMSCKSCLLC